MKNEPHHVKYPRRVILRKGMTAFVKLLVALLADVNITGKERLPEKGPVILAGNHVAALEPVLMAAFTPGIVEFIGNGDIPFDPNYALFAKAYGLIPVNRGNLDRKGLRLSVNVLNQGGILGIFPEGGTWDPANMQAQIGVAYLSYQAQAPVLPIGFGGMKDGLANAFKLKHPTFTMNVGEIIPPVNLTDNSLSTKANLEMAASHILDEINALIPPEDLRRFHQRVNEVYQLEIQVFDADHEVGLPDNLQILHGPAYARFLFNPTMMDVLVRNLRLPIKPLREVKRCSKIKPLLKAWTSILDYLRINPGYFTYRFGVEGGLAMENALLELVKLGEWVFQSGYAITILPTLRYQHAKTGAEVFERGGLFPNSM
jgi:1-acyl-sn-glycerol-3-phosphate acyltransferase